MALTIAAALAVDILVAFDGLLVRGTRELALEFFGAQRSTFTAAVAAAWIGFQLTSPDHVIGRIMSTVVLEGLLVFAWTRARHDETEAR